MSALMGSGAAGEAACAVGRAGAAGLAATSGFRFDPQAAVNADVIPSTATVGSHARVVILGAPARTLGAHGRLCSPIP